MTKDQIDFVISSLIQRALLSGLILPPERMAAYEEVTSHLKPLSSVAKHWKSRHTAPTMPPPWIQLVGRSHRDPLMPSTHFYLEIKGDVQDLRP